MGIETILFIDSMCNAHEEEKTQIQQQRVPMNYQSYGLSSGINNFNSFRTGFTANYSNSYTGGYRASDSPYYYSNISYVPDPQPIVALPIKVDEDYKAAIIELNEEFPGYTGNYEYSEEDLKRCGIIFSRSK